MAKHGKNYQNARGKVEEAVLSPMQGFEKVKHLYGSGSFGCRRYAI